MFDAANQMTPQEQLKAWLDQHGLTLAEGARVFGMKRASTLQYYIDPNGFRGDELPKKMRDRMADPFSPLPESPGGWRVKCAAGEMQRNTARDEISHLRGRLHAISSLIELRSTTSLTDAEVLRMISAIVKEEVR